MTKSSLTLPAVAFGFLLLLSFAAHVTGHPNCKWCVPNPSATTQQVEEALSWACGNSNGRADCGPVQPGQPCYRQDDVIKTATYVFNDYYHRFKFRGGSCDFNGAAILTDDNPTFDDCIIHCG